MTERNSKQSIILSVILFFIIMASIFFIYDPLKFFKNDREPQNNPDIPINPPVINLTLGRDQINQSDRITIQDSSGHSRELDKISLFMEDEYSIFVDNIPVSKFATKQVITVKIFIENESRPFSDWDFSDLDLEILYDDHDLDGVITSGDNIDITWISEKDDPIVNAPFFTFSMIDNEGRSIITINSDGGQETGNGPSKTITGEDPE